MGTFSELPPFEKGGFRGRTLTSAILPRFWAGSLTAPVLDIEPSTRPFPNVSKPFRVSQASSAQRGLGFSDCSLCGTLPSSHSFPSLKVLPQFIHRLKTVVFLRWFYKSFVRRGVGLKEKQRTCADCLKYFSCLDPFRLLHPEPLITPNDHKAKTCPSFIPAGVILMPSELPPFQSRGQDGGRKR